MLRFADVQQLAICQIVECGVYLHLVAHNSVSFILLLWLQIISRLWNIPQTHLIMINSIRACISLCEVCVSRRVCVSYCKDQHLNQASAKCSPGVIAPPTMFEMKHNHIYSFKYYLCLLSYYRVEWLWLGLHDLKYLSFDLLQNRFANPSLLLSFQML